MHPAGQRHPGPHDRTDFGSPDDMKLRSSMTLFARATHDNGDFVTLLARYYDGEEDPLTIQRLM